MSEYETDVSRWSERQGALLRRLAAGERVNDADLDWPNIAEEIETVGRSERAALSSHISNVLEHLISCRSRPPPTLVQAGGRPSCAGAVRLRNCCATAQACGGR